MFVRATKSRFTRVLGMLALMVMFLGSAMPAVGANDTSEIESTKGFRKAVTVAGIRAHQQALQAIADKNGGTRLAGTIGHDDSAQYVYDKAAAAGYNVSYQEFTFFLVAELTPSVFEQVAPSSETYVEGVDFDTMDFSGPGDKTRSVTAVDINLMPPRANTSGCETSDFAGFPAGNIALMQRGTCSFRQKVDNAAAAGASGAIIFNQGNSPDREVLLLGRLNPPDTLTAIPAIGTTYALGEELAGSIADDLQVRLKVDTIAENRTTRNVIAETPGGDPNHVIVIGAHLDSVAAGPGINDNGSGSAGILEIAEVFGSQMRETRNKLRFAWWSAEEEGLIGSTRYVDSLTQQQKDQIELNLNFDMIGSPNFVRFVYDGNNSAGGGSVGPAGSGAIEQVFLDYFASQGLKTAPTPFNGRSDYGRFIAVGIPAGGLFTGAEGIKTPQQAVDYGGTAGQPYDPCYHQACDTYENNSNTGLDQMSDAAAHAVLLFSKRDFAKNPLADPVAAPSSGVGGGGGLHADHDAVDR